MDMRDTTALPKPDRRRDLKVAARPGDPLASGWLEMPPARESYFSYMQTDGNSSPFPSGLSLYSDRIHSLADLADLVQYNRPSGGQK